MTPQRRIALVSVYAAVALIGVKLLAGLGAGSLGLIAEAAHSGTDLVAALLTFFAIGIAGNSPIPASVPAREGGAPRCAGRSVGARARQRRHCGARRRETGRLDRRRGRPGLVGVPRGGDRDRHRPRPNGGVAPGRASARERGPALERAPLRRRPRRHAGGAGRSDRSERRLPQGDSIAALFVAVLVLLAATRLMRANVDVLMDTAPDAAVEVARAAIEAVDRLSNCAAPLEARRGQGVRRRGDRRLSRRRRRAGSRGRRPCGGGARAGPPPLLDAVVRVEPREEEGALRERVRAAAATVPGAREVHNLTALELDDRIEVSLHLKLPGDLPLHDAHEVAHDVERSITRHVPEVTAVQTHVEPLAEAAPAAEVDRDPAGIERIVRDVTGRVPRETRFLDTRDGLVVFLTLGLDAGISLADAHREAGVIEERVHQLHPGGRDVIVHTEPTG